MAEARTIFTGEPCRHGHISPRYDRPNRECVACSAIREAARRERDGEKRAAREKARYHADPETGRTRSREAARRHRIAKGAERLAYLRQWAADNAEQSAAIKAKYRKLHPEQGRLDAQRRRCRLMGVEGSFTTDDIIEITERQKGRCACCTKKRALTIDHIQPISKGGSNWPSNIQMLCKPCNSRKRDKDPIAFMQEMGALL
jgi:5-methylcytosine-specific restriction endonuclease McrA